MYETIWAGAILGFGLLIGGAMFVATIQEPEINSAQSLCLTNGGIDHMRSRVLEQNSVFCKNGAKFILETSK